MGTCLICLADTEGSENLCGDICRQKYEDDRAKRSGSLLMEQFIATLEPADKSRHDKLLEEWHALCEMAHKLAMRIRYLPTDGEEEVETAILDWIVTFSHTWPPNDLMRMSLWLENCFNQLAKFEALANRKAA